jgi:hypothetical protein
MSRWLRVLNAHPASGAALRMLTLSRKALCAFAAVEVVSLGPRRGFAPSGAGGASGAPAQWGFNPLACYDVHHTAAAASGRRGLPSALPGAVKGRPPSAVDVCVRSAGTLGAGAGLGASRGCGAKTP